MKFDSISVIVIIVVLTHSMTLEASNFKRCGQSIFSENANGLRVNPPSDSTEADKRTSFSVMPYLSYNRNLDFMFGAIPMMMTRLDVKDTISPKTLAGVAAVYTTNNSYFLTAFSKFYFKEDTWRGTVFVGLGDLNSQFFAGDFHSEGFYNYVTNATILSVGMQRKIYNGLYGGLTYTYARYNTVYEDDIIDESVRVTNGMEVNALYDTRDNVYYPFSGNFINTKWITYGEWLGNEAQADKISISYNQYFPIRRKHDVFAVRLSGKFGLGDIAFEQQTTVGGKVIRGYSQGKYRGNSVFALQGEYRLNFENRMGVVGFAGLATLFGSDNVDFNGEMLPGAGVGFRYRAFKDMNFNIGLDAAIGKDDWGIYFRIGESF